MIYPFELDLQLFDEGGAAASGADGAGDTGVMPQDAAAGNSGVTQMDAASGRSGGREDLSQVQYGTQQRGQRTTQPQQPQKQDDAAQWQEAKTRYKAQYDADVQQIVRSRLRDADTNSQTLQTLQPMLDAMAKRFGTAAGDYQALADKYLDDDTLYEDEAIETGMSVEAVKQIHQVRAERDRYKSQVEQSAEKAQVQQHLQGLMQQGEALKQKYPFFDLQKEMQDQNFVRMTSPNGGLTVEQAYAALHHNELQQYAMQQAAMQSQRQAAQTVQANMARPRENAGRSTAPQATVRNDPSKLTLSDFDEIKKRVARGEKISFD